MQTLEKSMKFSHQIGIPYRSFFAVWMQLYAFHLFLHKTLAVTVLNNGVKALKFRCFKVACFAWHCT